MESKEGIKEDSMSMASQPATKPEGPTGDFKGDIQVDDTLPNKKMLDKANGLKLLDEDKKQHAFKDLHDGTGRTLVVFVRHFFCGVRLSLRTFHLLSILLYPVDV